MAHPGAPDQARCRDTPPRRAGSSPEGSSALPNLGRAFTWEGFILSSTTPDQEEVRHGPHDAPCGKVEAPTGARRGEGGALTRRFGRVPTPSVGYRRAQGPHEHGSVLVELALVVPLFLAVVLLGLVSTGIVYNHKLDLVHAARRERATETVPRAPVHAHHQLLGEDLGAARAVVVQRSDGDVSTSQVCVALVSGATGTPLDSTFTTKADGTNCYDDGNTDTASRVQVRIQRSGDSINAAFLKIPITLTTTADAKFELWADQGTDGDGRERCVVTVVTAPPRRAHGAHRAGRRLGCGALAGAGGPERRRLRRARRCPWARRQQPRAVTCQSAIQYVDTNASLSSAIDPASFCSGMAATRCSGGSGQATPTATVGDTTVSVHYPVPDSEIADARSSAARGSPTGRSASGSGCSSRRRPSRCSRACWASRDSTTRPRRPPGRGPRGPQLTPALWLLDPVGCTSPRSAAVPRSRWVRPACPVCSPSTPGLDVTEQPAHPVGHGERRLVAGGPHEREPVGHHPAVRTAVHGHHLHRDRYRMPPRATRSTCSGRIQPQPVSVSSRATRARVDDVYNCHNPYPASTATYHGITLIPSCNPATTPPYIDNLKAAIGTSGLQPTLVPVAERLPALAVVVQLQPARDDQRLGQLVGRLPVRGVARHGGGPVQERQLVFDAGFGLTGGASASAPATRTRRSRQRASPRPCRPRARGSQARAQRSCTSATETSTSPAASSP